MDDKLVRLSDVVDELNEWYAMYPDSDAAREALALAKKSIRKLPTVDAVEVCRCRECVNWRRYENSPSDCDMNMMRMGPEDYCSYGQLREDGDGGG